MKRGTETRGRLIGWSIATMLAIMCWCTTSVPIAAQGFGNPCDSVGIGIKYVGPGCCWEFILENDQSFQPFNSVTATVMTTAATVTSASGGFPASTTATTATWSFPNNVPNGNTSVRGCFNSPSGVLTLIFEWKNDGRIVCRDTVTVECPGGGTSDTCATDSLLISTGWDPYNNALHNTGDYTSFWQVIGDPSPSTTEPRPASVITKHSAWSGPLGTSQWISSYPNASNNTNGTYVFQTCFCVKDKARNVRLVFDILADDRARVYVNGIQVGATPLSWGFQNPATHVDTNITNIIQPGRNCIRVEVDNTNSVAMGLNMSGYLTADGLGLERSVCCDSEGILTGMKFWDKDCDGKRDPNEQGLPGWTIQLSNGATAVTDALGNYYFTNLTPGTYTVNEVNQPGWSQSYPLAPGTHTVTLATGQTIGNLDFGNCRKEDQKCLEYRADTTFCEPNPNGGNFYVHRFQIRSLLPCQFTQSASITVLSPAGVGVSPVNFPISSVFAPHAISIGGPGAVAGATVLLQIKVCCVFIDPAGNVGDTIDCCYDTVRIVLPDCPNQGGCKDCCKDFRKKIFHLYQWSSSNGQTSVGGMLQAGNTQICTVSATLVNVRINGNPVYGQFVPTNFLAGNPGTIPYMHEVYWTGVDVSGGPTSFSLRLKFPPLSFLSRSDKIEYCVRFRFTDKNCVTCDTVICFTQKRMNWIFPFPDVLKPRIGTERKDATPQGEEGPSLSGILTGEESGRLNVTFPEAPEEFGEVRFVGLAIHPAEEFIEIVDATSPDYTFARSVFGVVAAFEAEAGASTTVDLAYFGLNNRSRLDHRVTYRFVFADAPNDTLEETGVVTFYREGFIGGDELEKGGIEDDAKTFALYLHNKNGSDEPIGRLALRSEEGVEILAVGPSSLTQQAVIDFATGTEGADAAGIDLSGAETLLAADETIGPIYVTLKGFSGSTDLEFVTLNAGGSVVSEGTLTLTDNPTSVHTGGAIQSTGGIHFDGAYPNPTNDGATIRFSLGTPGDGVVLTVVDAEGREVARLLNGEPLHSGEHAFWFDTRDLASGTYYVTLRVGNATEVGTVKVLR